MSAVASIGRPRTQAEAADVVQVTTRTIRQYERDGKLRSTRTDGLPGPVRYTDEHLNEFFGAGPEPVPQPPKPTRNPKKYPALA